MSTTAVPLTENLLCMKIGIDEIMEKHEQMCALASTLSSRLDLDKDAPTYHLMQILDGMLSDMGSQYDIKRRIDELLSVTCPTALEQPN